MKVIKRAEIRSKKDKVFCSYWHGGYVMADISGALVNAEVFKMYFRDIHEAMQVAEANMNKLPRKCIFSRCTVLVR